MTVILFRPIRRNISLTKAFSTMNKQRDKNTKKKPTTIDTNTASHNQT